jgi:sn-glycerol 3-phosphate transport system ATP-binding protein
MTDIDIRAVRKSYGKVETLHGVDLEIQTGEFVVILGPSGCGKSTLLRMFAGLEEITAGEIAIGGKIVNKLEPRERGCAMVFQNYALYPHMTVAGNIGYALKVAGVPKAERLERVRKVAASVGLEALLDRKPAQLSGGQRQRVAMGRAMVREPKVFLFDEPFSNLDAKLRVAMREEVRNLHRALGVTSIFVTHDQIEAMTLADKLVIMNGGNVEQIGRPTEVYQRPASRFVAEFIGSPAMNLIEGEFDADGHFLHGQGERLKRDALSGLRPTSGRVLLGVRPESVRIASPDEPGSVEAVVNYIEELGPSRLIHTSVGGNRIVAVVESSDREIATGSRLHVSFDANAIHCFAAESGRRLEPAFDFTKKPETVL